MNPIIEFMNDYRDTIFYGSAALVTIGLLILGIQGWKDAFYTATTFVWCREFLRMMAWQNEWNRHNYRIAFFITILSNTLQLFDMDHASLSHIGKHPLIATLAIFLTLANMTFGAVIIILAGGVRPIFRDYWKNLFDWPRKQKPPKNRWDSVKRKIEDAIDKFRPGFVPSPAGC